MLGASALGMRWYGRKSGKINETQGINSVQCPGRKSTAILQYLKLKGIFLFVFWSQLLVSCSTRRRFGDQQTTFGIKPGHRRLVPFFSTPVQQLKQFHHHFWYSYCCKTSQRRQCRRLSRSRSSLKPKRTRVAHTSSIYTGTRSKNKPAVGVSRSINSYIEDTAGTCKM